MILLLIPILIVLAGAGLYALFTSRVWLIIMACIVGWCAYNNYRLGANPMAQVMKDVQAHREQWAAEDQIWLAKHHR